MGKYGYTGFIVSFKDFEKRESMNRTTIRLHDGVHLTCLTAGHYKTSVLSVGFVLPSTQDNTLAALLPQVLHRGTADCPDLNALGQTLDGLYGARVFPYVRKTGDAVVIGTIADVIDEAYAPGENVTARLAALLHALWYLPYKGKSGLLCPDYTAAEGANLADKIEAQKNDTRSYAVRRLQEILCAGEPYSFNEFGSAAAARAAGNTALTHVWQDVTTSAPIELFYCGSMAPDAVADCLRIFCSGARRAMPITRPHGASGAVRTVTEEMAVTQGKLSIGFRTGLTGRDAWYPALRLFSMVFGGYTGSRLFRHVREKMSLCYYASAAPDKLKGILTVACGIENSNFEVARDEILRQLADLQDGNLTDDELESARRTLLGQLRAMQDSPSTLERFFQSQAAGGFTYGLDTLMERVSRATRDEVLTAGRAVSLDTVYFLKGVAQ